MKTLPIATRVKRYLLENCLEVFLMLGVSIKNKFQKFSITSFSSNF